MDLELTTKHTVTFSVESFINEEGGMRHDVFGKKVNTLEEAIYLLGLAKAENDRFLRSFPGNIIGNIGNDWVIVCDVVTENKTK